MQIYTHPNLPKGIVGVPTMLAEKDKAIVNLYFNPEDYDKLLPLIEKNICTKDKEYWIRRGFRKLGLLGLYTFGSRHLKGFSRGTAEEIKIDE